MYYCTGYDFPGSLDRLRFWLWTVFNTGGPSSRTRKESISSSILGALEKAIRWPPRLRVGIRFPPDSDPRDYAAELIGGRGFVSPDDAKRCVDLPRGIFFCRDVLLDGREWVDPCVSQPDELLRAALILGLCNNHSYNPDRPVIWTNNRLTRTVELYEVGGFYDDD